MTTVRTLTLNPVIDLGSGVSSIRPNQKLRCDTPSFEAGGGGVNVSRALTRLGQDSIAVFPLGKGLGSFYHHLLEAEKIVCEPIEINARMQRINTNIREKESGDQYRFCMPGMEITENKLGNLQDLLREDLAAGDLLIMSGSLPPGVSADFITRLSESVADIGAGLILDAPGEVLQNLAGTPIDWVKPNLHELQSMIDHELDPEHLEQELDSFLKQTAIKNILLTLGGKGAVYAGEEGVHRIPAPDVEKVSTVGAGDSAVAGLVLGRIHEEPHLTSAQWAVAAGSATAKTPGTQLLNRNDFDALREDVHELSQENPS
jgi:6-phosphofructokinase 2